MRRYDEIETCWTCVGPPPRLRKRTCRVRAEVALLYGFTPRRNARRLAGAPAPAVVDDEVVPGRIQRWEQTGRTLPGCHTESVINRLSLRRHPEIVIKLADRLHQYGEMSGRGLPAVAARHPAEPGDRAPRPRGRRRVCVARAPRGSDF